MEGCLISYHVLLTMCVPSTQQNSYSRSHYAAVWLLLFDGDYIVTVQLVTYRGLKVTVITLSPDSYHVVTVQHIDW